MAPKTKKVPSSYRVNLTRLASNNANLRTPTVFGITAELPKAGQSFVMTGESLTAPGTGFRLIETSEVVLVGELVGGKIDFDTQNSAYLLEVLPDEEEE